MIDKHLIKPKSEVKFLGLILNENLDWSAYIKTLNSKLSKATYILNAVKNFLPLFTRKILYNSLFSSHLNYGLLLWGPNISKLQLYIK